MAGSPSVLTRINPIKFGTDGWRGIIAGDFTFERVMLVAPLAAEVLRRVYGPETDGSNTIVVGYDRRFLSEEFARSAAEAIRAQGFDIVFAESFAPTPAFSWAAKQMRALGAIVITASHNPGAYSGLKVKSAFGGSVPGEVTQQIEALIAAKSPLPQPEKPGSFETFNPWTSYCAGLQQLVDIQSIQDAVNSGKLTIMADVMHGAASTGLSQMLGVEVKELNSDRDPLFAGGAPEPLPKYLPDMLPTMKNYETDGLKVGLVFDGDCDRIAAVDGAGNFLSSQILIPILIEHLVSRGYEGEVVKTVSGSELIAKVAEHNGLTVHETPIGYKYIADRMLEAKVLLGGEESGGIGYGHHIPERDALLAALYVLETVVKHNTDLGVMHKQLQEKTGFDAAYDRIDLPLASMDVRAKLVEILDNQTPTEVAGQSVDSCQTDDGYKFRLNDGSWLLIRFSGTEPVLRLYCEAADLAIVHKTLDWARDWANAVN
ncbi:phosphoglucomutase/phosphomannomutase family protein [filamentous cyanobacterium LEGE 11480]|uniref:Phosphoglucomutase/phosphomannomutase family protein n=1 Tax=Romeriopsis navalis LEGE 11480 TaxID=2777977 RepID=A0A928VP92_9CYAN|nr:phosphoglucomutase/phosphomannomutase family protein [Romeriopsis navalis]MBE9031313.1 phosphoglucomutase/phosphomannomutase family protein [Romeriopsis navalis LEGE 11480]